MSTSVDLTSFLRSPSIYAHVADQIEEATLRVPMFNQLQSLADVCFVDEFAFDL